MKTLLELRRSKPRDRAARATVLLLALLVAYAWTCGDIAFDDFDPKRRAANLDSRREGGEGVDFLSAVAVGFLGVA